MKKNIFKSVTAFMLMGIVVVGICGCSKIKATNLTEQVKATNSSEQSETEEEKTSVISCYGEGPYDLRKLGVADFAWKLTAQCLNKRTEEQNVLVSPLSIELALAMTANGAEGTTAEQLQELLGGRYDNAVFPMDALNEYFKAYTDSLTDEKGASLRYANSIWIKNKKSLHVEDSFLQTNIAYYNADVYSAAFDQSTLEDINTWCSEKTDGQIEKALDFISEYAIMYLINALTFDAEWQSIYESTQIGDGIFTNADGSRKTVTIMHSTESAYVECEHATGFIKNYKNGYQFLALLPDEDSSVEELLASMDGETYLKMMDSSEDILVKAMMPKFSMDDSYEMQEILSDMGIKDAFDGDKADFGKLGKSDDGNIFINRIIHKTHIAVDERGTKAGAVTIVEMNDSAGIEPDRKEVFLDRPFVYAIIDSENQMPVFIGVVNAL